MSFGSTPGRRLHALEPFRASHFLHPVWVEHSLYELSLDLRRHLTFLVKDGWISRQPHVIDLVLILFQDVNRSRIGRKPLPVNAIKLVWELFEIGHEVFTSTHRPRGRRVSSVMFWEGFWCVNLS